MSTSVDSSIPNPLIAPGRSTESNRMAPLSELEDALDIGGDDAERALQEALMRVDDLASRTNSAMASGANRSEYTRLSALAKACESARQILEKYAPKGAT